MDKKQLEELFYQAIETELGGEQVYIAAIDCAVNDELREEWQGYLEETRNHQRILAGVFETAGLDIDRDTPGREVLRHKATGLIEAMTMAKAEDGPVAAQLVAAECVVEAESKDHQNWELIGLMSEHVEGDLKTAMSDAYDEVAEEEAEHLFHTMGWARELWLESLGVPAALPPPEEEKHVTTQIGAGRAALARDEYVE
ncbi:hypothetical protein BH23ACT5_BH23ACT5_08240 [soil metagenome]